MSTCMLCPRQCNIDRSKQTGFCDTDNEIKVARAFLHAWEEPVISGTKGSGTVFFSGCNLKCVFCQNHEISSGGIGKKITVARLAEIFKELEQAGAHNINLVTPSHVVPQIIAALKIYRPAIPIVYNTSGYDTPQTIAALKNWVDIYLTDIKFYDSKLSATLAGAPNYFEWCSQAVLQMKKNQPQDLVENGLMKKGVIVRHLVLPGCTADSFDILDWIAKNLGIHTWLSLMSQYTPCFKALQMTGFDRPVKHIEYNAVRAKAQNMGFHNGYIQSFTSCDTAYIPLWDFTGV